MVRGGRGAFWFQALAGKVVQCVVDCCVTFRIPAVFGNPGSTTSQEADMSITKERKTEIISDFRRAEGDTGSPEVQIAMLTHRIEELTGHLATHPKDHSSRRGLLMLVSQRRRLLDYLRRHAQEKYLSIIGRLQLRK